MPFFLTSYFWEFFFANSSQHHFFEAAVWGNVVAVLPLAILGIIAWIWHKGVLEETHKKLDILTEKNNEHAEHLKKIFDLLDPETDGGIAILHQHLAKVEDAVDIETDGGLKTVLEAVESLKIENPKFPK